MRKEPHGPLHVRMGVPNHPNCVPGNVGHSIGNLDNDLITILSQLLSQSDLAKKSKDITHGKTPTRNHGKEQFISFEHEVFMWMESHRLLNIIYSPSNAQKADNMSKHKQGSKNTYQPIDA